MKKTISFLLGDGTMCHYTGEELDDRGIVVHQILIKICNERACNSIAISDEELARELYLVGIDAETGERLPWYKGPTI